MLYVCVRDVMDVFLCLYCEAWSCRCLCMGSVSVSSCICCDLCASCCSSQFCMTCSLLMLVEYARGDHME